MALNPVALAALIEANMLANPAVGAVPGAATTGLATAIASAVCAHLLAAAEIDPLGTPPMVAGPTPVTGKGKIT